MEFLKEQFGDKALSYDALKAAVDAAADKIKIANLKDGGYVDKDKFTAKETELSVIKEQISNANKQIEDFKKLDVEGIKAASEKYKADYEAAVAKSQADMSKLMFDFALDKALVAAKAKNPKAVKALLDVEKLKLDGENIIGLKEQLDPITTSDAYLFDTETPAGGAGSGVKIVTGKGATMTTENPWDPKTYNMTEQMILYKKDPDKARALAAQFGVKMP